MTASQIWHIISHSPVITCIVHAFLYHFFKTLSFILTGSANLSGKAQGKMAFLTVSIFMATSLVSALIGICFVTAIQPGAQERTLIIAAQRTNSETPNLVDTFLDLIR